ncbi:MAG TPA: c-type cytochrome [bacterium]
MAGNIIKRVLKWTGIGLGVIVIGVVAAVAGVYYRSHRVVSKQVAVSASRPLYVPSDSTTWARGQHLATAIAGCTECHGAHFEGTKLVDDPAFGRLYPPNITRGKGGLPQGYDIAAFERGLRHGIRHDGTSLWVMPAYHYRYICDEDVAALWAYVSSVPPVDKEWPERKLGPIGNMLMAQGKLDLMAAPVVDETAPPPTKPKPDTTAAYGEYLARVSCIGCHRANLSGGPIFTAPPDWAPAANITRGGVLAHYTEADFFKLLRTGLRPGGDSVSPIMPWRTAGTMTDDELRAIWNYLQAVPPAAYATNQWAAK